jgi:predicted transposase
LADVLIKYILSIPEKSFKLIDFMSKHSAVPCKLVIIPQQKEHLESTLHAFADACNYIWSYGKQHGISQQKKLHEACYQHVREKFNLPANLTIRSIARVAILLKDKHNTLPPFQPNQVNFDTRTFQLKDKEWAVGLTLLNGREKFHLDIGSYQKKALTGKSITSAALIKKYKSYYLDIQI